MGRLSFLFEFSKLPKEIAAASTAMPHTCNPFMLPLQDSADAANPGRHDQDQDAAAAVQRQVKKAMVEAWKATKAAAAEAARKQEAAATAAAAEEERQRREERQAANKAALAEAAARRKAAQQAAAAQAMRQVSLPRLSCTGLCAGPCRLIKFRRTHMCMA